MAPWRWFSLCPTHLPACLPSDEKLNLTTQNKGIVFLFVVTPLGFLPLVLFSAVIDPLPFDSLLGVSSFLFKA